MCVCFIFANPILNIIASSIYLRRRWGRVRIKLVALFIFIFFFELSLQFFCVFLIYLFCKCNSFSRVYIYTPYIHIHTYISNRFFILLSFSSDVDFKRPAQCYFTLCGSVVSFLLFLSRCIHILARSKKWRPHKHLHFFHYIHEMILFLIFFI